MKTARQEILEKLRKVKLSEPEKPDFNAPIYHSINEPLEQAFKKNMEKVNGAVNIFKSEKDLFDALRDLLQKYNPKNICCKERNIQNALTEYKIPFSNCEELPKNIEVGITGCEFLIAHTGSAMVSSFQKGGRQMFVYPPVHIIIAEKNQIVPYLEEAYSELQKKYSQELPSQVTLITGPSRTADIEKTLILGAHGPKELHIFLT